MFKLDLLLLTDGEGRQKPLRLQVETVRGYQRLFLLINKFPNMFHSFLSQSHKAMEYVSHTVKVQQKASSLLTIE